MVEYLSFGAGPPSLALLILNVWGEVLPKAELVVYADTGWEKSETDRLVPEYRDWSEEMGLEEEFLKLVLEQVHKESIRIQTEILNS